MIPPSDQFPDSKVSPVDASREARRNYIQPEPPQQDYADDDDDNEDEAWCDHCNGMGVINCYCGGDLCVCDNNGEVDCPNCL